MNFSQELTGHVPVTASADKWNILEVLCYLADEEVEDFPLRIKKTLEEPLQALAPIDPLVLGAERRYATRYYEEMLQLLLAERSASIQCIHHHSSPQIHTRTPYLVPYLHANWPTG